MSRPRATSNSLDAFGALLADLQSRISGTEISAHRHDTAPSVLLPVGTIVETLWTTDPIGYLLLDGRTIASGATAYPVLWPIATIWQSGTDLVLPNTPGKMVRAY